jgi:hypothetical protein
VLPRGAVDPGAHQYGIITLIVKALLAAGAKPDPDRPAQLATHTERQNWGRYPIIFSRPSSGRPSTGSIS